MSLHSVSLQAAVDQGLVEKINKKTGRTESRQAFLGRLRAECIDQEQWLQEYCCTPADENSAFFPYDLLNACEDRTLKLLTFKQLADHISHNPRSTLYLA